jgi:hypothetical protein
MVSSCKSLSPRLALYYIHRGTIISSSLFSSCSSNKDLVCYSANCIRINFWLALGSPPRVTCCGLAMTWLGALGYTQCCTGSIFRVGHRTAMTFGPGLCFCSWCPDLHNILLRYFHLSNLLATLRHPHYWANSKNSRMGIQCSNMHYYSLISVSYPSRRQKFDLRMWSKVFISCYRDGNWQPIIFEAQNSGNQNHVKQTLPSHPSHLATSMRTPNVRFLPKPLPGSPATIGGKGNRR